MHTTPTEQRLACCSWEPASSWSYRRPFTSHPPAICPGWRCGGGQHGGEPAGPLKSKWAGRARRGEPNVNHAGFKNKSSNVLLVINPPPPPKTAVTTCISGPWQMLDIFAIIITEERLWKNSKPSIHVTLWQSKREAMAGKAEPWTKSRRASPPGLALPPHPSCWTRGDPKQGAERL